MKDEQITADAAIDRYADMVYRLARSQMKNTTDADDLFQEVFVRLVSHIQDLESWEHVKAWLIRVTINCAKKHYEQYWNRNVDYMEEPERMADEGDGYELPEEHPVRAAVQKLPPKYRAAIFLRYYEGYAVGEIARMLGVKPALVSTWLARGREKLKMMLGGEMDESLPETDG